MRMIKRLKREEENEVDKLLNELAILRHKIELFQDSLIEKYCEECGEDAPLSDKCIGCVVYRAVETLDGAWVTI